MVSPGDPRDPDLSQRRELPAATVRAGRSVGQSGLIGVLAVVAGVLVAVAMLRSGAGARVAAAATDGPSAPAVAVVPTPQIAPSDPSASPPEAPTPVETDSPAPEAPDKTTAPQRTPRPTRTPKPPAPTPPTSFSATVEVDSQCSTAQGLQVVGIQVSFASPDEITRVDLFVDGALITSVQFDEGVHEGVAGSGTPVTPDEPHEVTASFYAAGDDLVESGVSSGQFTVELTEACGG